MIQFVPFDEIRRLEGERLLAALRLNVVSMIQQAGSGHLGSSLSVLRILMNLRENNISVGDIVAFSSKGHDAPAWYAMQHLEGTLGDDALGMLRVRGGLCGHPERGRNGQLFSTGSLGMGLSKAVGYAWANATKDVVCVVGDGEMQEGQVWEAAQTAERLGLGNLTVIIDANGWQSDTRIHAPGDRQHFGPFGAACWTVHPWEQGPMVIRRRPGHPVCVKVTTPKGWGVLEPGDGEYYEHHSGALSAFEYGQIRDYLLEKAGLRPEVVQVVSHGSGYSEQLMTAMACHPEIVVLDADLERDCGLSAVKHQYPDRYIECGIGEQNMVSMASGLAAAGRLPIVHSFAAFLTRAHEQIRDVLQDTNTRVIFVGHMAGKVPNGGPGRSHHIGDDDLCTFQQGPCLITDSLVDAIEHPGCSYVRLT